VSWDTSGLAVPIADSEATTGRVLIVEDGFTRGSLAACRALARDGWIVGIGSPEKGLAASSRWAHRWHRVPPVEDDFAGFLEETERAVRREGYEAVFCSSDAEALGLSFGREEITAIVPYPPHDNVVRAIDKLELTRAAHRVDLAAPRTVPATAQEIRRVRGPVLVKARLHWTPGALHAPSRLKAAICHTPQETQRLVDGWRAHGAEAVLQEVITGRLVHFMTIIDADQQLLAAVQTLAEPLTNPPMVGQRVRSVTVPVDPELERKVRELFIDLGWVGLASLNLLLPEAGEVQLIDFNGRYSASFDQYIAAGPNFPAIWARMVTGRPVPPRMRPKERIRFQWLEGDLRRALVQRRGGLVRDVVDCLSYAPGAVHTLWRWDDPVPTLRLLIRLAHDLARKLMGKLHPGPIRHGHGGAQGSGVGVSEGSRQRSEEGIGQGSDGSPGRRRSKTGRSTAAAADPSDD
jgi:predicted ATP-grasp superfamily ATP-dependent carboligase